MVECCIVNAIAPELREVITNLIVNAVDSITESGTITLRTTEDEEHAIVEVRDTGSGMSAEVKKRCLEPFFSTKGDAGMGLGLAMVFGIIERHQGQLEIDSEVGEGSTFRILLSRVAEMIVTAEAA